MGMSAIVIPKNTFYKPPPKPKSQKITLKHIEVEEIASPFTGGAASKMLVGRGIESKYYYYAYANINRVTPFCCSTGQLGQLNVYKRVSEFSKDMALGKTAADTEFAEYTATWLDRLTPLGTTPEDLMCWSFYLRTATRYQAPGANAKVLDALVQKAGFKPTMSYTGRDGEVVHYNKANDFNNLWL